MFAVIAHNRRRGELRTQCHDIRSCLKWNQPSRIYFFFLECEWFVLSQRLRLLFCYRYILHLLRNLNKWNHWSKLRLPQCSEKTTGSQDRCWHSKWPNEFSFKLQRETFLSTFSGKPGREHHSCLRNKSSFPWSQVMSNAEAGHSSSSNCVWRHSGHN